MVTIKNKEFAKQYAEANKHEKLDFLKKLIIYQTPRLSKSSGV